MIRTRSATWSSARPTTCWAWSRNSTDRDDAGDRRILHRRPDRPRDHRDSGREPVLSGGVVSYSNEAKVELLGVPAELIEAHGAVSPEVAEAMATGVRQRLRADLGLSITGVAGPSGGTAASPSASFISAWPLPTASRRAGSNWAPNSLATSSSAARPRRR